MKAIIAAGGSGTRLRPLTFSLNKHLLPVANKPLLFYPLEAIAETGIKQVGIVVNQTRPAVENLVGTGKRWGFEVTYIDQPEALGLAHVVKISEAFIAGDPFVYHLGDNIFTDGILKPFTLFSKEKPDGLVTMVEHPENYRLGVPFFDDEGNFVRYVEKPENPPNQYGCPGLYMFSNSVFGAFRGDGAIKPSARGELEVGDLYNWLIDHGHGVIAEVLEGKWMDPGRFDDMLEANAFLLEKMELLKNEGEVDTQSQIYGSVVIGSGTRVVNSQIIGPVSIADNVLIEDSVVGPHVSIDHNCKLESVTIRNSIVMQDSSLIDTKREIVDSLIGRNTEVWEEAQNTVSLFIGDHCKVRIT